MCLLLVYFSLVSGCNCGSGGGGLFGLELLPVVFYESLLLAVTETGVEVVLLHLSHYLLEIPIIFMEAIQIGRAHV
jgi:hypothetical protein